MNAKKSKGSNLSLNEEDKALITKLQIAAMTKQGRPVSMVDVVRSAIELLAERENITV